MYLKYLRITSPPSPRKIKQQQKMFSSFIYINLETKSLFFFDETIQEQNNRLYANPPSLSNLHIFAKLGFVASVQLKLHLSTLKHLFSK